MYRTLAWYCLKSRVDIQDAKAVAQLLAKMENQMPLH